MGLCASMLQRRTEKRYPEPRRGTARALFVVRGDRQPSNPEGLVVRVQDSGRTQLQRYGGAESGRRGAGAGGTEYAGIGRHDAGPGWWQRRILMGMRCELPRFSGLVLYDEHGWPIQVGTPGRRTHRQKKTGRTSSTTTSGTSYRL
ncbi:hypothetical protein ZWY2020_038253 [Hordeum vulgare]|nr:hypothetical protein ZWY2020_038253 [Hordeum vulgare]